MIRPVNPQGGFTLIELVLAMAVLAIAISSVVVGVNANLNRANIPHIESRAVALGQAYLEEILAKPFDENTPAGGLPACNAVACTQVANFGPDNGEPSRPLYDDVDDYHGINDNPPADAEGDPLLGYPDFTVQVTVSYDGDYDGVLNEANETTAKLVQVQISHPLLRNTMTFAAYRGGF